MMTRSKAKRVAEVEPIGPPACRQAVEVVRRELLDSVDGLSTLSGLSPAATQGSDRWPGTMPMRNRLVAAAQLTAYLTTPEGRVALSEVSPESSGVAGPRWDGAVPGPSRADKMGMAWPRPAPRINPMTAGLRSVKLVGACVPAEGEAEQPLDQLPSGTPPPTWEGICDLGVHPPRESVVSI